MYTRTASISARFLLAAAPIAYSLFAGNAKANDHVVTDFIAFSKHGLDLSEPAGAQQFYRRLGYAAYVLCIRGNKVGLAPVPDPRGCYERALAEGIRYTDMPLVTLMYLSTHTARDASARGIAVPAELAAK
jgi:UrcA family protein